jgi:hypothetical protein
VQGMFIESHRNCLSHNSKCIANCRTRKETRLDTSLFFVR